MIIDYGVGIETVGYVTKGVTTLALISYFICFTSCYKERIYF